MAERGADIHNTYEKEQPGSSAERPLASRPRARTSLRPVALPAGDVAAWGKTTEEPRPTDSLARSGLSSSCWRRRGARHLRTYTLVLDAAHPARRRRRSRSSRAIHRSRRSRPLSSARLTPGRRGRAHWHHQGLRQDTSRQPSHVACYAGVSPAARSSYLLDRLDLIEQTTREFESAGVEHMHVAETKEQLQDLIVHGQRGVIVTTIFRFAEAGHLTDRSDVIVLADEAHRTQEGILGLHMRTALPNATFIGMTGTPISDNDHDTFETFGDADDPDQLLSAYSPERSMADGATLPIRVEAPRQDLELDQASLDAAYDELADEEGLTEEEKERLARKVSKVKPLLRSPEAHRGYLRGHRPPLLRQGRAARTQSPGCRLRP